MTKAMVFPRLLTGRQFSAVACRFQSRNHHFGLCPDCEPPSAQPVIPSPTHKPAPDRSRAWSFRLRQHNRHCVSGGPHLQRRRRRYRFCHFQGWRADLDQWTASRPDHFYQGGTNSAASDAAVAYDAKHGMWLISTLPIGNNDLVATSRSTDGLTWSNPVLVTSTINSDKNWITCDNWPISPFYGNCYTQWDSPSQGDLMYMSTSTDGGATWGPAQEPCEPRLRHRRPASGAAERHRCGKFRRFWRRHERVYLDQWRCELERFSQDCQRSRAVVRMAICAAPACRRQQSTAAASSTCHGRIAASAADARRTTSSTAPRPTARTGAPNNVFRSIRSPARSITSSTGLELIPTPPGARPISD